MGQVLVLNASYEPLNITTWRRAVVMMLKGKAESLEHDPCRQLRQGTHLPTVIRLRQYVRVPFRQLPLTRRNLFQQRAIVTSFRAGDEHSRFFFRAPPMSTNKLLPAWRATSFAGPSLCLTFLVQRTKTRKSSSCSRSQQQQKRQELERAC